VNKGSCTAAAAITYISLYIFYHYWYADSSFQDRLL